MCDGAVSNLLHLVPTHRHSLISCFTGIEIIVTKAKGGVYEGAFYDVSVLNGHVSKEKKKGSSASNSGSWWLTVGNGWSLQGEVLEVGRCFHCH